jgi:hypothetical protein
VTSRRTWLVVAIVILAVAAILLYWRGCRQAPPEPATEVRDFLIEGVTVVSPDLAVGPAIVRGTVHPGYTDWACLFECREPDGCRAEVRMVVSYLSQGQEQSLIIGGTLQAASDETVRIGRVQRPPTAVDEVRRATLEIVAMHDPNAPAPTPIE